MRLLTAAALSACDGVVHGFTTRAGGVSTGPLATLNLARRPGETDAALRENWERVARALDPALSAERLALLSQVHGRDVVRVEEPSGPLAVLGEADGLVTTRPGLILAVRAADCVPVLIAAPGGVAAAHSGWRGTAQDVVGATVAALVEATGQLPETFAAAIGPCIGGEAYEVGEQVVDGLSAGGLDPAAFVFPHPGPKPHVDLGAAVAAQLRAAGVSQVERIARCTFGDPELFSHRRDPAGGRLAGVIALSAA